MCAFALLLAGCGPNLGGLEAGEEGKVARTFGGAGLELDNGLSVYLAEIDAPRGDAPYARQAQAEMEGLADKRDARLAYGGARRLPPRVTEAPPGGDAEVIAQERAVAHVFIRSEGGRWFWLQHELVSRGAAFVRPRPDNHARVDELFAVEAQARAAERGLWGERAYRTLSPREAATEAVASELRCQDQNAPFRFVEGVIDETQTQTRRASLRFTGGHEETPALAIVVFGRAFANWRGPAFDSYDGKRVRVRGRLETFRFRDAPPDDPGRPQICVDDAGRLKC